MIDHYSFIVACLSACITILLGYNIYQTIDIKCVREQIKNERKNTIKEKNKMLSILYLEIAKTQYRNSNLKNWVVDFEYNSLKSIHYAFENYDLTQIEDINQLYSSYDIPLVERDKISFNKLNDIIRCFTPEQIRILRNYKNLEQLLSWIEC